MNEQQLERIVASIESIAASLSGFLQQRTPLIAGDKSELSDKRRAAGRRSVEARRSKYGSAQPSPRTTPNKRRTKPEQPRTNAEQKTVRSEVPCIRTLWNERCGVLPKCERVTAQRQAKWVTRWNAQPDIGYWADAIDALASSEFCRGGGNRGWKANIDFLLRPDTAVKAHEGAYSNGKADDAANGSVYQFRKYE